MADESSPVALAAAATVLPEFTKAPAAPRAPRLTLIRRRGSELAAVTEVEDTTEAVAVAVEATLEPVDSAAAPEAAVPVQAAAPVAESAPSPVEMPATVAELQAALRRERERADAAESANAVLRRKLAALDDELASFRPRAIIPFEDTTD